MAIYSFKRYISFVVALCLLTFPFLQVQAASNGQMASPQTLLKAASEEMTQAIKDNKQALDADPTLIYGLVETILMPNFDFEKMSKLALGKNWRGTTQLQQQKFVEQFKLLLIRTYATAMLEYSDQEITFLPLTDDLSSKRVKVDMEVSQKTGGVIPMTLFTYQNNSGKWMVYDVKINGISLVTNYRSTFSSEINNKGIDQLIEDLAARNEKIVQ